MERTCGCLWRNAPGISWPAWDRFCLAGIPRGKLRPCRRKEKDRNMRKALMIPYTFNLLNLASVAALYHFVRRTAASDIWIERAVGTIQAKSGSRFAVSLDKALPVR